MKRLLALVALGVSFLSLSGAIAADLPSGDSLMQRFIERSGGEAAYARAKNAIMTGTVEMVGRNVNGTVTIVESGEKSYTGMEFAGIGLIEEGFDGETAWENSALTGPRLVEGDEKAALRRASTLATTTKWREAYKAANTKGAEDVDGKPAWRVEMVPLEGKPEIWFFEKDSGLLVRMSATLSTPLGELSTDVSLSAYRAVDGIQTPFTMTQNAMGQSIVMRFSRILYNADLPAGRFDPPQSIRNLQKRKQVQ